MARTGLATFVAMATPTITWGVSSISKSYDILCFQVMSTLVYLPASFLGILVYLFLYWRKFHEDWDANEIFPGAIISALSTVAGGVIMILAAGKIPRSAVFEPLGLWFWGALSGFFISFWVMQTKNKMKGYEVLDISTPGLLMWYGFLFLANLSLTRNVLSLVGFFVIAGLIGVYYYFNFYYKRFTWYKSGKVGFSGLAVAGLFFLFRSLTAIFVPEVFSIAGRMDGVISGALAFLLFFMVYNLAEWSR